jgi:hypothetical protein
MELYEEHDRLPIWEAEKIEPVVRRLIERALLSLRLKKDATCTDYIHITGRGLTALRGGDWEEE